MKAVTSSHCTQKRDVKKDGPPMLILCHLVDRIVQSWNFGFSKKSYDFYLFWFLFEFFVNQNFEQNELNYFYLFFDSIISKNLTEIANNKI